MLIEEVYDALKEAGASEEKSRAAAKAIASHESTATDIARRLDRQDTALEGITASTGRHDKDLAVVTWMLGFNLALSVAILFRLLTI